MTKSTISVYLDTDIKNLIHKEVAEINLANPEGKRIKVSNIVEGLILEHFKNEITKGKTTLVLGGK